MKSKAKAQCGVQEMAQQVKALTTKPDDLNSIPRTHMVVGEKLVLKVVP